MLECKKFNNSAKHWQISMSYALLDGYTGYVRSESPFFTLSSSSHIADCKQDSSLLVWCRMWCWTGKSKCPVLYPRPVFLSHALGWPSIKSHSLSHIFECGSSSTIALMNGCIPYCPSSYKLFFISSPARMTWSSHTLAC